MYIYNYIYIYKYIYIYQVFINFLTRSPISQLIMVAVKSSVLRSASRPQILNRRQAQLILFGVRQGLAESNRNGHVGSL